MKIKSTNGRSLRKSSSENRQLWRISDEVPSNHSETLRALLERVKELNCLYGVAQLVERHAASLADLFAAVVDFLPLSWQEPELTCARIVYEGRSYESANFKKTIWRQAVVLSVNEKVSGEVEIFYLGERPAQAGTPFLPEEGVMLEEVARRISAGAVRLETEQALQELNRQLTVDRTALQESNMALRAVLARIEEEKQQTCREVQANIQKIVLPVLNALALELPVAKRNYADILRKSLEEVTSPFGFQMSQVQHALTPAETAICNFIRTGLSSKEIAELRGVAVATVLRQRERIRSKLGLGNKKVNLASYLHSLSDR